MGKDFLGKLVLLSLDDSGRFRHPSGSDWMGFRTFVGRSSRGNPRQRFAQGMR